MGVTREVVMEALEDVHDAHIPVSLREMGMIRGVTVNGDEVHVKVTFPCMGCPGFKMILDNVKDRASRIEGVKNVKVDAVWDVIWTKENMSERAKTMMREAGIQI